MSCSQEANGAAGTYLSTKTGELYNACHGPSGALFYTCNTRTYETAGSQFKTETTKSHGHNQNIMPIHVIHIQTVMSHVK